MSMDRMDNVDRMDGMDGRGHPRGRMPSMKSIEGWTLPRDLGNITPT